eukprot:NODE_43_length_33755_cov_1.178542.p10 type:complete len:371 gc:universal NODE_43_length_33755_cov_1.178542:9201-8089(-)
MSASNIFETSCMPVSNLDEAKAYLAQEFDSEPSLYAHLVKSMKKILHERPANPKEAFGILTKEKPQISKTSNLTISEQEKLEDLLKFRPKEERAVQDICKLKYLLECGNIQIDKSEFDLIAISIERLAEQKKLSSCRYWGRFEAKSCHYHVVEAELTENLNSYDKSVYEKLNYGAVVGFKNAQHSIPVPVEEHEGPNKYVYFVCKKLYDEWLPLPDVIPHHIVASRSQKFQLTGYLENGVRGYPPFFGNESQLLRALIARINASTSVAPINFFIFDEKEDEEAKPEIILNPEFQPEPAGEMVKAENWVHSVNYILPQGRCNWVSSKRSVNLEEEEETEMKETDESNTDAEKPEIGPSLLSSIDQDESNEF